MGAHFNTKPTILFDEAIRRLRDSGRFILERPKRQFLYDGWTILSLDRTCLTSGGRISRRELSETDKHTDPTAKIFFYKAGGPTGEQARQFLLEIGRILSVEIMTEYDEPVSDAEAWSVESVFDW